MESVLRFERFPDINAAVDAYNIVAARTGLAFGVHDVDRLRGGITFRLSDGDEPFRSVGATKTKTTQRGDYLYADDTQVLAWLDSKDSDDVKLSDATRNMVMVVQGTPYTSRELVAEALEEAATLVTKFCGGSHSIVPIVADS